MSDRWQYNQGVYAGRARANREGETHTVRERIVLVRYHVGNNASLYSDFKNLKRAIKSIAPHLAPAIIFEHRKTQKKCYDGLRAKAFFGRLFMKIGFCFCVYLAFLFAPEMLHWVDLNLR